MKIDEMIETGTYSNDELFSGASESDTSSREEDVLTKAVIAQGQKIRQLNEENREFKKIIDSTRGDVNQLKKDANTSQYRFIQTFGIFVGLFTFISVEFGFLKSDLIDAYHLFSLTFILLGGLGFLIYLLTSVFTENSSEHFKVNRLLVVSSILIFIGLCIMIASSTTFKNWAAGEMFTFMCR